MVCNKIEAAYRRSDLFQKRRQLADAWSRFLATPIPAGECFRSRRRSSVFGPWRSRSPSNQWFGAAKTLGGYRRTWYCIHRHTHDCAVSWRLG
jgi:hypothetical protein